MTAKGGECRLCYNERARDRRKRSSTAGAVSSPLHDEPSLVGSTWIGIADGIVQRELAAVDRALRTVHEIQQRLFGATEFEIEREFAPTAVAAATPEITVLKGTFDPDVLSTRSFGLADSFDRTARLLRYLRPFTEDQVRGRDPRFVAAVERFVAEHGGVAAEMPDAAELKRRRLSHAAKLIAIAQRAASKAKRWRKQIEVETGGNALAVRLGEQLEESRESSRAVAHDESAAERKNWPAQVAQMKADGYSDEQINAIGRVVLGSDSIDHGRDGLRTYGPIRAAWLRVEISARSAAVNTLVQCSETIDEANSMMAQHRLLGEAKQRLEDVNAEMDREGGDVMENR